MPFKKQPNLYRSPKLAEQVADFLALEIKSSSIQPGETFPSEAQLSERFEVSRTVIREALASLKHDGLLESKQGSKSVVAQDSARRTFRFESNQLTDLAEISYLYEFRSILESEAAAIAAKRRTQKDLIRMRRCLEALDQAMRKGLYGTTENLEFHQSIVDASGNPFLKDFMRFLSGKIWTLIQTGRNKSGQKGLPTDIQHEHVNIFEAIEAGDSKRARDTLRAHFRNAANRLGLNIFNFK